MAKLYELRNDYESALLEIDQYIDEDGVISEEYNDLLNGIKDDIRTKSVNVAEFIKRLIADEELYAKEIERLTTLKKRTSKKIEYYKNYLTSALQTAEIDKVEDVKATISFKTAERLEIGEKAVIPKKYQVVTLKPDKTAIKKAIQQGKTFKDVKIVEVKHIQIK